ncbi:hypothetical protein [Flaviflagellibacter deserti]|jgi:hypothetical protein|uniref:Uncharacterized protein n=1 Tax=Flaviflagellibacter deserti TaxID=2267266 RepID=A0ABV9Z1R0_9HYPH
MANKNRVPKKIAGFKVPKQIRKSPVVKALIGSEMGRQVIGNALIAGATAAAGALAASQTDRMGRGAKKSGRVFANAADDALSAIKGVIAEATQSLVPSGRKRDDRRVTH